MFEWFRESEDERKLREDIVKYYQPSMRVISNGCGGWCLVMSVEDGRRTARNKNEDDYKSD